MSNKLWLGLVIVCFSLSFIYLLAFYPELESVNLSLSWGTSFNFHLGDLEKGIQNQFEFTNVKLKLKQRLLLESADQKTVPRIIIKRSLSIQMEMEIWDLADLTLDFTEALHLNSYSK